MANPEHVEVVRRGAEAIAEWRRANPGVALDLSGSDLRGVGLSGADLTGANLRRADLSGANLTSARLFRAYLLLANLSGAILKGAEVGGGVLLRAELSGADLTGASAPGLQLMGAKLVGANLSEAYLVAADFTLADLREAVLRRADVGLANLTGAGLREAEFSQARLAGTALGNVDLSQVIGLGTVRHEAPSSVGVDTLIASFRGAGNRLTAELVTFFRGAGVPEELLDALPGIAGEVKYYTCFIAYGQPDVEFARKLCQDLESRGISCWLYDMDATPGERTWGEIVDKRRGAEKVVVLCSHRALVREGVLKEIEEQIDEDPDKLMPVSLDDLWQEPGFKVMRASRDLKPFLMDRNYADFANLGYEEALDRLLAGLRRKDE